MKKIKTMKMRAKRIVAHILSLFLISTAYSQTVPTSQPAIRWAEEYYQFNHILGIGELITTSGGDTTGKPNRFALKFFTGDSLWYYWNGLRWRKINSGSNGANAIFTFNGRSGPDILPTSGDYNTSLVPEGSGLYWTTSRFDSRLATKTTSDLAEGTGLYWTNSRFDTRFDTRLATKSTSDLPEGTALYWTAPRGDARIALQKGALNGIASLDGSGKVPVGQLPAGAQTYQGTWNVSTNTPTLADGAGTAGDTYRITVGGTRNLGSGSIVWVVGDDAIYNGTIWQRNPTSATVASVNGQTNVVVLTTDNIAQGSTNLYFSGKTTTNLPEGAGLYFTTTRVRSSISASGSLAYNSATGVISYTTPTIPAQFNPIQGTSMTITGTYPNITFAASVSYAQLTSKPTTLAGYGITDASLATHTHTFASLTSKPTTLSGYGITNAYTKTETDAAILAGSSTTGGTVQTITGSNSNGFTWTITNPTVNPNLLLNLQFGIADGSTTGKVGFIGSEFFTTNGIARLNYAGAQSASPSLKGFLAPADYSRFDAKANVPTGAITTVYDAGGTANKVAIFNSAGKFISSRIDTAHLGYIGLVRSDLQKQIDDLANGGISIPRPAIVSRAADFTVVLGDENRYLYCTKATAQTVTIPTNATAAFQPGDQITFIQDNTGIVTFAPAAGVTLNSSNGLRTRIRNATVTGIYKGGNVWTFAGDLKP